MKVAVVRPLYDQEEPEFQEPCGAQAICGFLRDHGYDCRIFDRRIGATVSDIEQFDPDCVGFSVMSQGDMPDALRLLLELKKDRRHFFAGGLFVTTERVKAGALFPRDTFLISGEGELPATNYLRALENKPPLPKQHLHPNDWSQQARENLRLYLEKGGVLNIRSSRGCRGNCTFCTTPGLPQAFRHFQVRNISLVADEIENAAPCMTDLIVNFTDDEFGDLTRIDDLENELRKRELRAAFSLELRAAEMLKASRADWTRLHSAGLCRIFTGLESLNPRTLRAWKKPMDPEALLDSIRECRESGIVCEIGYILWHPDQSVGGALREIGTLYEHGLFSPKAALSRLILFPGSALHAACGANGVCPAPLSGESNDFYGRLQALLSPLFTLRNRCAFLLPNAACASFLHGDDNRKDKIQALMKQIDDLAYDTVMKMTAPDAEMIRKMRSETDEICGAGQRVE